MGEMAFVSFRLPRERRDRLASLAKGQGRSLQDLMTEMVDQRLAHSERHEGGVLPRVIATLRAHRDDLTAKGVVHLWVFGSVARGEDHDTSDVDLAVEIAPEADLSLTGFSRLRLDLEDLLTRRVDLAEWSMLPKQTADAAQRDAVVVF
jgi:predicted nucleotidyltransferase